MPLTKTSTTLPVTCRVHIHHGKLAAVALLLFLAACGRAMPSDSATTLSRLPPQWRDDRGGTLKLQGFGGAMIFVTMAYTSCHRICPMTMARLAELQRDLDSRGTSAEFLIVSYDPGNDDPAAWRRYRNRHGLLRQNWHFLSGTVPDTERLARLLGFEFWRDGDHVMHDYRIVALGRDGAQRGVIDAAHGGWRELL